MAHGRIEQPFRMPSDGQGNGNSVEIVRHLRDIGIQLGGPFTATVAIDIQTTATMPFIEETSVTAETFWTPPNNAPIHAVRLRVSGYAAGTITAALIGRQAQF